MTGRSSRSSTPNAVTVAVSKIGDFFFKSRICTTLQVTESLLHIGGKYEIEV